MPLKFGPETTTSTVCARTEIIVRGKNGECAGWGETPLSVAWVWPSRLSYEYRLSVLKAFCKRLCAAWAAFGYSGHPMEIGKSFIETELKKIWLDENKACEAGSEMPWLAALVCNSLFDVALHDAYGMYHHTSSWNIYTSEYMNHDLSWYYSGEDAPAFAGRYPQDFLVPGEHAGTTIPVWHLVGAKDAVKPDELTGDEPNDGYPVLLEDWIRRDGLDCLKIKLTGINSAWDYRRLVAVGLLARRMKAKWLSADFNCTVTDPAYVCEILDRLKAEHPDIHEQILYVEQPFPYDIKAHPIDVRDVSARKPLFMDESAHDWEFVKFGRELGWTGVALKTCKTITGALLSLCWAKEHDMPLMVQDLTNPMLAQIPHVGLAVHAGTIMGVESNAMQFYPEASRAEGRIHPGLYTRKRGLLDFSTLGAEGFGYRLDEIKAAAKAAGDGETWEDA